jgi:hypothetical protein
MFRAKALPLLLGILALKACAVAPPSGPAVVALPPEGKDLARFQQEDTGCRGYAQQQIGYGSPQQAASQNAVGSVSASASVQQQQQQYDIAYAQCMAASGNTLRQFPGGWPYGPYGYPYAFSYYEPWFGLPVAFGFFGGFGHNFHHQGFHHQGFFHHGFHQG